MIKYTYVKIFDKKSKYVSNIIYKICYNVFIDLLFHLYSPYQIIRFSHFLQIRFSL